MSNTLVINRGNAILHIIPFILIMLCSFIDSGVTLHLVHNGFMELNPIMNFFLSMGTVYFLAVKYVLTLFGVTILYVNRDKLILNERFSVLSAVLVTCFAYVLLIIYEFALVTWMI